MNLKGKVAIVTGAGSDRGIGRAIVLKLAKYGVKVGINDVDTHGIKMRMKEIESLGGEAINLTADITNENQVNSMVQKVIDHYGKIDILVNNAGITSKGTILDASITEWDRIIDTNLKGAFICSKAVLPHMIQKKQGRLVFISSVSARQGGGVFGGVHYSAAKAGILGLGKTLARQLAEYNITSNMVCPGVVDTDIASEQMTKTERKDLRRNQLKSIPLNRLCKPEEIAELVAFLSSDKSGYITGEVIDINGGSFID